MTIVQLGIKILFCGLSEAGKTAIKKVVFEEEDVSTISTLSATIDYERTIAKKHGVPLLLMDLGGQRVFMDRFLSKYSPFVFYDVRVFIYVVDVSKPERIEESLAYFKVASQKLKEHSPQAQAVLFFHKVDNLKDVNEAEKSELLEKLKENFLTEAPIPMTVYYTTIYEPDELNSIFQEIFRKNVPEIASRMSEPVLTPSPLLDSSQSHRLSQLTSLDSELSVDQSTLSKTSSETTSLNRSSLEFDDFNVIDDLSKGLELVESLESGVRHDLDSRSENAHSSGDVQVSPHIVNNTIPLSDDIRFSSDKTPSTRSIVEDTSGSEKGDHLEASSADLKEITDRLKMMLNLYKAKSRNTDEATEELNNE